MINYIIQVILFQVLFLAVYDLFLSRETFFTKNRWYLMGTAIVSFLIPLIKIPSFQKALPQEINILLPEIVLSPQKAIESTNWYQSVNYINVVIGFISVVFLLIFILKLIKIVRLIFKNEVVQKPTYNLVLLPKQTKAFSFFKYIFLGKEISENQREKIIKHELVHSTQKHSIDLLFFEFLKIVMWFNPMIWLYQKRVTLVHEYISDEVVTKETTKESYINNILSDLFQVENISFINQFYKHSLIKKRIIMMTKEKSKQIKQLKYLLLIPVLVSMLFYSACSNNEDVNGLNSVVKDYQSRIRINNTNYYLRDLGNGEILVFDDKKSEIDLKTILPPGIKSMYFENGNLISVFEDKKGSIKTKDKFAFEFKESEDVPFSKLDKVPTFPGCADGDKDCFNLKMREFVQNNFNYKIADNLGLKKGKNRIYIKFKIDKYGAVDDVKIRAPHPKLKAEGIRITSVLPQMKPGFQRGKPVSVGYTLPITFKIE